MATSAADGLREARLETPRLVLRPIRDGDVERCVEILLAGGATPGRDHVADFRDEVEHWTEHGFGPWVAEGRESGAIVGTIDVNYAGPGIVGIHPEEVEVGWMIDRALWGRGLGPREPGPPAGTHTSASGSTHSSPTCVRTIFPRFGSSRSSG